MLARLAAVWPAASPSLLLARCGAWAPSLAARAVSGRATPADERVIEGVRDLHAVDKHFGKVNRSHVADPRLPGVACCLARLVSPRGTRLHATDN